MDDEQNVEECDDDDADDDVIVVDAGHGCVDSLINNILSWKRPSLSL